MSGFEHVYGTYGTWLRAFAKAPFGPSATRTRGQVTGITSQILAGACDPGRWQRSLLMETAEWPHQF